VTLALPVGSQTAQATQTYSAASTVLARVGVALIDFNLTVGACVPGSARASVAPLAGVGARGTVLAGLVVGAVVQVCKRIFLFFKKRAVKILAPSPG